LQQLVLFAAVLLLPGVGRLVEIAFAALLLFADVALRLLPGPLLLIWKLLLLLCWELLPRFALVANRHLLCI
jgi:hypothetical protein